MTTQPVRVLLVYLLTLVQTICCFYRSCEVSVEHGSLYPWISYMKPTGARLHLLMDIIVCVLKNVNSSNFLFGIQGNLIFFYVFTNPCMDLYFFLNSASLNPHQIALCSWLFTIILAKLKGTLYTRKNVCF